MDVDPVKGSFGFTDAPCVGWLEGCVMDVDPAEVVCPSVLDVCGCSFSLEPVIKVLAIGFSTFPPLPGIEAASASVEGFAESAAFGTTAGLGA